MKKYIFIILSAALTFQSCNAWLDLKPSDRIAEETAFSSAEGFKMALNGIYIDMASSDLYGKNLTYDFMEVLANRYYIDEKNADMNKLSRKYEYIHNTQKGIILSIWTKGYYMIANLNLILKNCETNRSVLPDDVYAMVKGEALALRAMMHFDLMRIFGPTPSSRQLPCIPYYNEFSYTRPANENLDNLTAKILTDLDNAAKLLKPIDPVIDYGRKNGSTDVFMNYRYFRLNYYAVKAIEARVCIYSSSVEGMKERALGAAKEVIAAADLFPFATPQATDATLDNPDYALTMESIFSLQLSSRNGIYLSQFNPSSNLENGYYVRNYFVEDGCFYSGEYSKDIRSIAWFNETKTIGSNRYYFFRRYKEGADTDNLLNQEFPLIRIAEMYYIAAECEPEPAARLAYINVVRKNRLVSNKTGSSESSIRSHLTNEYMRDFWGEGQLFFYYKRLEAKTIRSGHDDYDVDIKNSQYMVPKPDGETQYDNK